MPAPPRSISSRSISSRHAAAASVDQPSLIHGAWTRDGGVVVEASFAGALGVRVGDRVTLDGRSF